MSPRRRKPRTFRTPAKRLARWDAKTDPNIYPLIFRKVKPLVIGDVATYQASHESLIAIVKSIVNRYGSEASRTQAYVWYAQGLQYEKMHKTSLALQKHVNATFMYYLLLGLNEQVLREIANALGLSIPSITDIVGEVALSEEVVYRGTKRALKETLERVETDLTDAEFIYNAEGNLTQIIKTDKITGRKKRITLEYDAEGNLIRKTEEWI